MNLKRILFLAGAVGAIAAAAAVCVVALSYALYALAETWLSPAGAAALVATAFALIAVGVALVATRKAVPKMGKPAEAGPVEKALGLAKERPLVAVAAAAVVGVVLFRNPAVVSAVVSALVNSGAAKGRK